MKKKVVFKKSVSKTHPNHATGRCTRRGGAVALFLAAVAVIAGNLYCWSVSWILGASLLAAELAAWLIRRLFFADMNIGEGEIVLFFGLPGSGKSMFLARSGVREKRHFDHVFVNDTMSSYRPAEATYTKEDLGKYDFDHGLLLFDEASLNGFDNRDWSKNFTPEQLSFMKQIRKYHCSMIFSNQGWDEMDAKIRKSLTSRVYYVENHGFYSTATLLEKDISVSEITGDIQEGYVMPSLWDRIKDPSKKLYAVHKRWGKTYDTYQHCNLPSFIQHINELRKTKSN